ncbi:hypothetical protein [Oceaniferula marina]|nr:hypothetical protein [Oceaniferula marina]
MKNTLKKAGAVLGVSALTVLPAAAQTDAGTLITAELTKVSTAAPAVITAGLVIFGLIFGVRKLKSIGRAAS